MQYPLKPIDANGEGIAEGDEVLFKRAPATLISGLPIEDQIAIKAQAGKPMKIVGFDEYGHAEMEFISANQRIHTIWVEPKELFKV